MRQIPVRATLTALLSGLLLLASVTTSSAQSVRVIVELRLPSRHVPEGDLPDAATVISQRQAIAARTAQVLSRLAARARRAPRQFQTVPFVALEVTPEERAALALDPDVERVLDDVLLFPVLTDSAPLVEADQAWNAGYDGTGTVIAGRDTGVDKAHPFLSGKVVEEACYSKTEPGVSETLCPNGLDQQIGLGAAVPCTMTNCFHGTHVAGIAAGNDPSAAQPIAGVAKGAHVFAIQVFTKVVDPDSCGGVAPCIGVFSSDVIAGLERVYSVALSGAHTIVSVNMSLGGNLFTSPCNGEPYKPIIDNLRTIGVATIVASGNSGIPFAISSPGCISSAVSVGSTSKDDTVSSFSNVASFLSLLRAGRLDYLVGDRRHLCSGERHVDGDAARRRRLGSTAPGGSERECVRDPCQPAQHRVCRFVTTGSSAEPRFRVSGCCERSHRWSRSRIQRPPSPPLSQRTCAPLPAP